MDAVDAADAPSAGVSVVKSVPTLNRLWEPSQRTLHPKLKMPSEAYRNSPHIYADKNDSGLHY